MADTTAAPLAIPAAAYTALHDAGDEPMREYVTAIASPVVVMELHRLAGRLSTAGHVAAAAIVLARADELDPSGEATR